MKIATTAERLNEYMEINNLRQIDMVMKCQPYCRTHDLKMTKEMFWHYVKGDREPKYPTLKMFAESFNVDESWLAGYDVPMQHKLPEVHSVKSAMILADAAKDSELISCIEKIQDLPAPSKKKVYGYVDALHDAEC